MSEEFRKDQADPQVDLDELDKLFGIDNTNIIEKEGELVDVETGEILKEVNDMRKEIATIEESLPDVDKIITDNIERANRILDKVEDAIVRGDYTASMIDAVGKLIDSVTSAATSITGISYNNEVLRQKDRDLDRKEKELAVKQLVKGEQGTQITNNNLIMNREDLMKLISDSKSD